MKKAPLILIFFSIFATMSAQTSATNTKEKNNFYKGLDFSAGYSIPFGNYGASDQSNKKSGYAANGFQVQVGFDWMGKKDFGLAIQYTFQRNPINNEANLLFPHGIPDSVGSGLWTNHYLMLGPVFMKTIKKLYIDAKILGGVVLSSSTNFNTPDPTDTLGLKYNKNTGTGFAYQISGGVGYMISSHFTFKFNLSLMGGWLVARKQYPSQLITYELYYDPVTGLSYYKPVYSAPAEYEIKKVVTTLNPSIGLVYRF